MVTINSFILDATVLAAETNMITLIVIGLSGQTEHNGAVMTAFINNLE